MPQDFLHEVFMVIWHVSLTIGIVFGDSLVLFGRAQEVGCQETVLQNPKDRHLSAGACRLVMHGVIGWVEGTLAELYANTTYLQTKSI